MPELTLNVHWVTLLFIIQTYKLFFLRHLSLQQISNEVTAGRLYFGETVLTAQNLRDSC